MYKYIYCINYSKEILKADAVFVSMGPGIAGTGTKYGFTGIEQGSILDAVKNLKEEQLQFQELVLLTNEKDIKVFHIIV